MSSLVIAGDTSGSVALQAPAVAGATVLTLPATSGTVITTTSGTASAATTATTATNLAGGGANTVVYQSASGTTAYLTNGTTGQFLAANTSGAPTWGTPGGITLGTPVNTTSGTSVDYTSLPAGLKRITVNFVGVSTSSTSQIVIQLGDSGGIEDTGYVSLMTRLADGSTVSSTTTGNGFSIYSTAAAAILSGSVVINLENSTSNTWCAQGNVGNTGALLAMSVTAGNKSLSAQLDRIRITTSNGADTFDAGQINISYE